MTSEPPRRPLPEAPAILVVLTGALGDIARALPLVSLLKHDCPGARLSWLVDWRWRELVAVHPGVDRLVAFPHRRTPASLLRLARELRAERLDITLDLQRHLKSGLCSGVSGARRRIGFHPSNAKEFNHVFNTEHIGRRSPHFSKLQHYLVFAEHLRLSVPESLDFGLDRLANPRLLPDAVRAIGSGFVGIVMGSSWRSKDWTADGYAGLISLIVRDTPRHVVLLGDSSQRHFAERLVRTTPNPKIVNLVGRTSVTELGATLAAAQAAVGPDSGPGHLSAALGTPYVTLFGPTDVERVVPYRCESLAVRSPADCQPCWRRRCRRRAGRCMDAITPAMVWPVLEPLLH